VDVKKIMLIVGALVIALGAAFGVNRLMRGAATPAARAAAAPQIDGPKVLVATRALPVGTILTPEMLRFQPWPQDLVRTADYYVEGTAEITALAGSVVRFAATAGAPLTHGAVVNPGDRGFLAAALGPGMRAVAVPLSPDQGVAGFVFPGDRVDVILTLTLENEADNAIKLNTSETVVRNLRVLAVDQRSTPTDTNGATTPLVFQNVTLEATPRIAELIAVSRSVGTLSLSLRSLAETSAELEEAIASGATNVPRDGDARGEARMLRGANGRPAAGGGTGAVTGGDVSRNLRRAMPSRAVVEAMRNAGSGGGGGGGNGGGGNAPPAPPAVDVTAPPAYTGPTVRVVRGNEVTVVPVRGN
jgi:pilus assembly protein CpaB